jgi:hypothetical protein
MDCERSRHQPEAALALSKQVSQRLEHTALSDADKVTVLMSLMSLNNTQKQTDTAVAIADELAPLAARSITVARRGFCYRVMARAYAAAGRFEDAERYALLTHASFERLYPHLNSENEWAAGLLIDVYSTWRGHESDVATWATRAAAYRLMLSRSETDNASAAINASVRKIAALRSALTNNGTQATYEQCMELLWQRRNELAPTRHPRRAWFFANFALLSKATADGAHFDEALAAADEALPDAFHADRVRELIAGARAM